MSKIAVVGSIYKSFANALLLPPNNKVSACEFIKKDVTE